MFLYYDRVSKMFTLNCCDGEDEKGVTFLGPITNALVMLKNTYKLSDSQAREAVLQAFFNGGDSVDISTIKKIASDESEFFKKNAA